MDLPEVSAVVFKPPAKIKIQESSIDHIDGQNGYTVPIYRAHSQGDRPPSIDLADNQRDRTASTDFFDSQQNIAATINRNDSQNDNTVPTEKADSHKGNTAPVEQADSEEKNTVSIDVLGSQENNTVPIYQSDSEKDNTVTIYQADSQKDNTVSIEKADSQKDSTVPIEKADSQKDSTVSIEKADSQKDSTVPIHLLGSQQNNSVPLYQADSQKNHTLHTDQIDSQPDNTVPAYLIDSQDDNTVSIDLVDSQEDNTVPLDLRVNKLNYTVTDNPGSWWQKLTNVQMPWEWFEVGRTNHILQDVSFTAKSGQLIAIMGGSGSGKTSLLDVLAYRTSSGIITGQVYLNSTPRTKELLEACSGYVRQEDRLIGSLTTRETLTFVAQLKLPRKFTSEMITNRVDMIIAELGLKHAADTRVGDAHIRGLSGGERRRVSIGIQLLILPSILFLDEPTSGLDSFTARNLVQTLSRLALKKRTIIMSIHQPRFDIFSMVDTMMILSRSRLVYNGPGKEIVNYFAALGFPCPPHTNPCDFCIDLATVDATTPEREEASLKIVQRLQEAYQTVEELRVQQEMKDSAYKNTMSTSLSKYSVSVISDLIENRETSGGNLQATSLRQQDDILGPILIVQFYILFKRFIRVKADNYVVLLNHMVQALFMSLLLGVVYIDLKYDEQSVRDWLAIMFNISVMYSFMVILTLIGACHEEKRFLYFELQDRLYSPSAYYFARVLSDVPFHLVYVLIYCIPVYGIAGLKTDAFTCFMFFLFVSVSVFTSRSLAMMSAALLPTYQLSSMLAQILFSLFIMGAGFFINLDSIMPGTKWISSASYLRWSYESLCIIGITDLEFHVTNSSISFSGSEVLKSNSLGGVELWHCAVGLGVPMLVFLSVMFVGLKFIPQKPTNE